LADRPIIVYHRAVVPMRERANGPRSDLAGASAHGHLRPLRARPTSAVRDAFRAFAKAAGISNNTSKGTMETVLIVIHLMVVVALVAVILLQRSEGGALGIGGGGGGGFMSARGTGNALTKATAVFAFMFFATSIGLTVLARNQGTPSSILDDLNQPASQTGPAGADPTRGSGQGILDTLRPTGTGGDAQGTGQPAAPAVPAGPQVPSSQ
jgi:preprotein translocase subunit SecG